MRILFYNNRYAPSFGGTETHLSLLTPVLRKLGNSVEVLTTKYINSSGSEKFEASEELIDGTHIERMPALRFFGKDALTIPFGIFKKIQYLNSFDVFHVYTYGYASTALIFLLKAWRVIKIPLVFQPHYAPNNTYPSIFEKVYTWIFGKLITRNAASILLLTRTYEKYFQHLGAQKITIIPPAIKMLRKATPAEQEELLQKISIPQGAKIILSVSRLTKGKGLDLLIDSFSKLPQISGTHLVIAGQGTEYDSLKARIAFHGLERNVHLITQVSDTQKEILFSIATSFVLLSYSAESFGITLVEAMQFGLPILASDKGAIPNVLRDYGNSIIVSPFDQNAVTEGLKKIISYPTLEPPKELSRYSPETIANQHQKLYEAIASAM